MTTAATNHQSVELIYEGPFADVLRKIKFISLFSCTCTLVGVPILTVLGGEVEEVEGRESWEEWGRRMEGGGEKKLEEAKKTKKETKDKKKKKEIPLAWRLALGGVVTLFAVGTTAMLAVISRP